MNSIIYSNLIRIKEEITQIIQQSVDKNRKVNLIAVSKGQSIDKIEQAILSGHTDFAESYWQEANIKWPVLKEKYPQIKLHFIGHLQSNKVKGIVKLFDVIHTLDRITIIKKISNTLSLKEKNQKSFLLQVLLDHHSNTKKGILISNIEDLIKEVQIQQLHLIGLMGIPDPKSNVEYHFSCMQKLAKELNLKELSMGMSSDYKEALKYGATMLRIGEGVFGIRK